MANVVKRLSVLLVVLLLLSVLPVAAQATETPPVEEEQAASATASGEESTGVPEETTTSSVGQTEQDAAIPAQPEQIPPEPESDSAVESETSGEAEVPEETEDAVQPEATIEQLNVDLLRAFVVRLYELVLERAPEQSGLDFWAQNLQSRARNAAQLVEFFFQSDEYKAKNRTDDEYIRALYRTMMNREPDVEGLAYWKGDLAAGLSRKFLLHSFVNSPEFASICDSYGIERGVVPLVENRDQRKALTTFVNQFYLNCMGRPGDADGLNYWTGELMAGQRTGGGMAEYFFFQNEFASKNTTDTEFLQYAYRAMFNREPDATGLAFWLNMQQSGRSRQYVLNAMVEQPEYRTQCEQVGIAVGSVPYQNDGWAEPKPSQGSMLTVTWSDGQVETGYAYDILARVVMAEVGGFRHPEVYKAQAIAAHSYILYCQRVYKEVAPGVPKPNQEPTEMCKAAVKEVAELLVQYQGQPILAAYSAASNGKTNPSGNFWNQQLPYLISVDSHYDVNASDYQRTKAVTKDQFLEVMAKTYLDGNYDVSGHPSTWIQVQYDTTGYVLRKGITLCGTKNPSSEYFTQTMFGIRSPAFQVEYDDASESFIFTTQGNGHGVGMSQWGANFFAKNEGWSYQRILAHYYPGTTLGIRTQ